MIVTQNDNQASGESSSSLQQESSKETEMEMAIDLSTCATRQAAHEKLSNMCRNSSNSASATTVCLSLRIYGSEETSNNSNKRRRQSRRRSSRRRRRGQWEEDDEEEDEEEDEEGEFLLRNNNQRSSSFSVKSIFELLLNQLQCYPFLHLKRLFICHVESSLPLSSICQLIQSSVYLEELVFDDLLLEGEIVNDDDIGEAIQIQRICTKLTSLKSIALTSCGPSEDELLHWLLQSTLECQLTHLSLKQMLLWDETWHLLSQIGGGGGNNLSHLSLDQMGNMPKDFFLGFQSSKPSRLSLESLTIGGNTVPFEFLESVMANLCPNLQTLSLSVSRPNGPNDGDGLKDFGNTIGKLLQTQSNLQHLSLTLERDVDDKTTNAVNSPFLRNFVSSLTRALSSMSGTNSRLQSFHLSLDHYLCEVDNEFVPSLGLLVRMTETQWEALLRDHHWSLHDIELQFSIFGSTQGDFLHSFSANPTTDTIEYYTTLNKWGRYDWMVHGSKLGRSKVCELLSNAALAFPDAPHSQASMLIEMLSANPSWLSLCD